MRLLGFEIAKAPDRLIGFSVARAKAVPEGLTSVDVNRGWYRILESFAGAWQRNVSIDQNLVTTFHADFACKTLIARDASKLRIKLVQYDESAKIWRDTKNPAYDPVLRVPNHYQTRNQFWESWFLSKLSRGNTYALKGRDGRGIVTALYVLDPMRCRPLVAPNGDVFYDLKTDHLSGIGQDSVTVPASEIIHDRFNCLFHPLVGLPPVYASGLAATQGLNIQTHSTKLYQNAAAPGGILTAPGAIDDATAQRLKDEFNNRFSGENAGKTAVLGNGLKFEKLALTAVESQLIEQLKWTAEVVCSTYHVPPYKIGVGPLPSFNNVQALNVEYYSQCLQSLLEDAEECLDRGLGIGWGTGLGTEFDTDNLLRMDSVTQMDVLDKGKNVMKPNEARQKLDLPPVEGGDAVYRQQQDYSLAALSKRDAKDDPFASGSSSPARGNTAPPDDGEADPANDNSDEALAAAAQLAAWELKAQLERLDKVA